MSRLTNPDTRTIRAITRDGKPWFVATDVCAALEIDNPSDALARLNAGEARQAHEMSLVSESGLYKLVCVSRKPGATQLNRLLRDAGLREKFTRPSPSGREFWPIRFAFPAALGVAT